MFDLNAVQVAIREAGFDGWLLYDFRGQNVLAQRVARCGRRSSRGGGSTSSRRTVSRRSSFTRSSRRHSITCRASQDDLPPVAGTRSRRGGTAEGIEGRSPWSTARGTPIRTSAAWMPAPSNSCKSFGCRSGGIWRSDPAVRGDVGRRPGEVSTSRPRSCAARPTTWPLRSSRIEIKAKGKVMETAVQARIMKHFADNGMTTYSPPIVGVGPHSGDPHFDTEHRRPTCPINAASSCSSTCGPRSTARGPSTPTTPAIALRRRGGAGEVHEDLQHRRRGPRRGHQDA